VYREGGNAAEGTDIWAVQNGYVSVTPMRVDETERPAIDTIAAWFR
jgi:5'-nucleotidase